MKQYPYGANKFAAVIGILFFGGLAYFSYNKGVSHADFDYKGLHYTGDTAFYIYMGLAGISMLLTIGGLAIFLQQLSGKQFIEVTALDITMPKMLFRDKTTIRFADIIKLEEKIMKKNHTLIVRTAREKIEITRLTLQSNENYEEIKALLFSKMPPVRSGTAS